MTSPVVPEEQNQAIFFFAGDFRSRGAAFRYEAAPAVDWGVRGEPGVHFQTPFCRGAKAASTIYVDGMKREIYSARSAFFGEEAYTARTTQARS
jgi:hypothetical protein